MSPRAEAACGDRDLVLLHGWGVRADVWQDLAQRLSRRFRVHLINMPGYGEGAGEDSCTLEQVAAQLARRMPSRCLVCGWSLGGQVALAWAAAAPQQIAGLALIATTPCFIRRADWPHAMEAPVFGQFAQSLRDDCRGALQRFAALQAMGDARDRQVQRELRKHLASCGDMRPLECGLRLLHAADLRLQLARVVQPTLILHGERDALTPAAAARWLQRSLPEARLSIMADAAHAPFMSDAADCAEQLADFFQ